MTNITDSEEKKSWQDFKVKNDRIRIQLSTKDGKLKIPNLEDADFKKQMNAERQRTLILVEGKSAKTAVMRGVTHFRLQTDYGVYPLSGKFPNALAMMPEELQNNKDFQNIINIIGLNLFQEYDHENLRSLRYQHLMLLMDQDHDGSHLKGLIVAMFYKLWPSLLRVDDFLLLLNLPLIKVFQKRGNTSVVTEFSSIPQYLDWLEKKTDDDAYLMNLDDGYDVDDGYVADDDEDVVEDDEDVVEDVFVDDEKCEMNYYRGIGSYKDDEVLKIFADIEKNTKRFIWLDEMDDVALSQAFGERHVFYRRKMMRDLRDLKKPDGYFPTSMFVVRYDEFVHNDLAWYFKIAGDRSFSSIVDGLTIGRRKMLQCAFEHDKVYNKAIGVVALSGNATNHFDYWHRDTSAKSTIIKMAQNFVGKNNINLLSPIGEFGSRAKAGGDHADASYLKTRISSICEWIFPKEDECILQFSKDENGKPTYPKRFLPILPLILVNGCKAIAPGYTSTVPCFNPVDIIENLIRLLNDEVYKPMVPWYNGFKGKIVPIYPPKRKRKNPKSYISNGIVELIGPNKIKIRELPPGEQTNTYRKLLDTNPLVKEHGVCEEDDVDDDGDICFDVVLSEEVTVAQWQSEDFRKVFLDRMDLTSKIKLNNMVLLDVDGEAKTYDSVQDIMMEFYHFRLQRYKERKIRMFDARPAEEIWRAELQLLLEKLEELRESEERKKEEQKQMKRRRLEQVGAGFCSQPSYFWFKQGYL